jgi:hypothetical protein
VNTIRSFPLRLTGDYADRRWLTSATPILRVPTPPGAAFGSAASAVPSKRMQMRKSRQVFSQFVDRIPFATVLVVRPK